MSQKNIRLEVMQFLEKSVDSFVDEYLIPVEKIWQPSDLLPNSQSDTFFDELKELREIAKDLPYDFWVVLVGDTITEEALPTYESWLMDVEGVDQKTEAGGDNGWAKWLRQWTGEENRHGDLLSKYLYLSGRVNMREVEITTQHLINDGFDPGTGRDPYRNFVFTSFQELATYVSHNRVAQLAKKLGDNRLAKMCKIIAGDEMRHHLAYSEFVNRIFKIDASEMLLVYTALDYVDILEKLIAKWEIEKIVNLTDEAEKARDYLLKLPSRMTRIAERMIIPSEEKIFKWVQPALIS